MISELLVVTRIFLALLDCGVRLPHDSLRNLYDTSNFDLPIQPDDQTRTTPKRHLTSQPAYLSSRVSQGTVGGGRGQRGGRGRGAGGAGWWTRVEYSLIKFDQYEESSDQICFSVF